MAVTPELFAPMSVREDMSMKLHRPLAVATASTVLAAMLSLATPAQAQTYDPKYPVCLQIYQGFVDYYFECAYTSMPQCQMSASGRAASCVINPYYAGPKAKRSKKRTTTY
jgi:Protein of unknown function (DUF3551)